jgi:hypothetical protein
MPRPSFLWYATNLQEQAAWHVVFNKQAQIDGTTYGLTSGEVDQIKSDMQMVVALAAAINALETYDGVLRAFRKGVMELAIDGTTPTWPGNLVVTSAADVPRGIWERVIDYADRIKASAGYTNAVGESYGIVGVSPSAPVPAAVKPDITLIEATHGFLYTVVVSKREDADAWQVFDRPANTGGAYRLAATGTGKSIDITYNPGTGTDPVQLEVYVQLRRNNANYGQPSEIGLVTANP